MTQRRPVYAVPASPPTVPPTYTELQELKDFVALGAYTGDTPHGITYGPTFPANPAPFHRHYLTWETIDATEEWFYWDPRKNSGAGAWLSERLIVMEFGKTTALTNAPMDMLGLGISSSLIGYSNFDRPMTLVASRGTQATSGGDAGMRYQLKTSENVTEVAVITMGTNLNVWQPKRDIAIPAQGSDEIFFCRVDGTSGVGVHVQWLLRRRETNP